MNDFLDEADGVQDGKEYRRADDGDGHVEHRIADGIGHLPHERIHIRRTARGTGFVDVIDNIARQSVRILHVAVENDARDVFKQLPDRRKGENDKEDDEGVEGVCLFPLDAGIEIIERRRGKETEKAMNGGIPPRISPVKSQRGPHIHGEDGMERHERNEIVGQAEFEPSVEKDDDKLDAAHKDLVEDDFPSRR